MLLTASVEVTTPGEPFAKSGIGLGTSAELSVPWHGGVGVGVGVTVAVGTDVPQAAPVVTLRSSRYQPSLDPEESVASLKRKRRLRPTTGERFTSTGTHWPPVLPVQASYPGSGPSPVSVPLYPPVVKRLVVDW